MCLKSNPFAGASGTSWADFALGAGTKLWGFHQETKEVDRINRARLLNYKIKEQNYHRDYQDRVIGWKNTNLDDAIEVDNKYKESLGKLAESKLKVWDTIKQGTIAEQEAFAAMMSVGGGEQTGRRSCQTISRKEAVMSYGQAMNKIAITTSSTRDNAALFSSQVRDAFAGLAHAKDIKSGTSRPTYGPGPVFEGYKDRPSPWSLALGVGKQALSSMQLYDKLKAPESSASTSGSVFGDIDTDIGSNLPWPEESEQSNIPFIYDTDIFKDTSISSFGRSSADRSLGSNLNIPFIK